MLRKAQGTDQMPTMKPKPKTIMDTGFSITLDLGQSTASRAPIAYMTPSHIATIRAVKLSQSTDIPKRSSRRGSDSSSETESTIEKRQALEDWKKRQVSIKDEEKEKDIKKESQMETDE